MYQTPTMERNLHLAALACHIFTLVNSQTAEDMRKIVNNVGPAATDFYIEIPFEYNGGIILKAAVGGKAYDFILDTGGYTMINSEVQQDNDFYLLGRMLLGSTNGIAKEADIVKTDGFTIGGLEFYGVPAYCIDLAGSPKLQCMANGGIIGSAIIQNHIWQIDYPNRKIIITDKMENLPEMEGASRIPVYLNGYLQPYFMSRINGRHHWLMFDTGCSSLLWMGDKDAANGFANAATAHTSIIGGSVETHHGRISDTINVFRADCAIEGLVFEATPAYYRNGSGHTLFGSPVIKDYIVTLNFSMGEMYFKKIGNKPVSKGWKSFGFTLHYEEGKCSIDGVVTGTPAETLGLRTGDTVTAINGITIACDDFCGCWEEFSCLLETSDEITLTLLKGNKPKKVKIKKGKVF